MKSKLISATIAGFLAVTNSNAQQPTPPQPCSSEDYRAFDFWLGEWEVSGTNDQIAGVNRITSEENGCLILEKWTSTTGGTGQSYNFFDPGTKQWRQIWVSTGAVIDYSGGLNDQGEMVLTGEIRYHNGTMAPFRGIWTLLEDGRVKQHFDQFNAEDDAWQVWFTGFYKKIDQKK